MLQVMGLVANTNTTGAWPERWVCTNGLDAAWEPIFQDELAAHLFAAYLNDCASLAFNSLVSNELGRLANDAKSQWALHRSAHDWVLDRFGPYPLESPASAFYVEACEGGKALRQAYEEFMAWRSKLPLESTRA